MFILINMLILRKWARHALCSRLKKTQKAIYDVTGEYAGYIRPPYGCWQKELDAQVNLIEVLWNVDPRDWATTDADTVVQESSKGY